MAMTKERQGEIALLFLGDEDIRNTDVIRSFDWWVHARAQKRGVPKEEALELEQIIMLRRE